jgi:hypothetical protein
MEEIEKSELMKRKTLFVKIENCILVTRDTEKDVDGRKKEDKEFKQKSWEVTKEVKCIKKKRLITVDVERRKNGG